MSSVPVPCPLISWVWELLDWLGTDLGWSEALPGIPGAVRVPWVIPLPGEPALGKAQGSGFPGAALHPGQSSQALLLRLLGLLLWFCSFPAHPSAEESEQHLLVRSAGSTCGMPLITMLIGFLLVPSIFSKQKAGGSRCYLLFHNKCCSCGDQRSRNCGAFFSFLFTENCSKTFNPLEKKLLIELGCLW